MKASSTAQAIEKPEKQRIQLDLSKAMCQLLDHLVEQAGAASRAEVIRRAMSIYGVLLDEHGAGRRVEIIDKAGTRERLILP